MNEIDYSEVMQPQIVSANEEWEAPVHKFFGKKLPNGKMEKEPVYYHQDYPRFMYHQTDGKIKARVVNSDAEMMALGEGWSKTPADFGHIGAPSFDQAIAMKNKAVLQDDDSGTFSTNLSGGSEPAKRGRPAKV